MGVRAGCAPRVLQILPCDDVGGTEAMVASLIEHMDPARVRSELAVLSPPGPVAARTAAAGIRVRVLGGAGFTVACARLARIVARERFDVLTAYGLRATVVARVLRAVCSPRSAFVCGVRGLHVTDLERIDGTKSRVLLRLERLGSPLVDAYDANSRGALELLAASGIDRSKLHHIPNGIHATDWARADPAEQLPPTITCVARFVPLKRHVDLVDACAQLMRQGIDFRLVLAGRGPERESVRSRAFEAGLDSRVDFPGVVTDSALRRLLAASSIFCLCSLWEGMPGSVMEAMAAGLPVVGTRVNGIEDLVIEGTTGSLVPPSSPDQLAAALRALLLDPATRRRFGRAGREHIEREYGVDRMVRDKERLYRRLAGAA
jgi:glycosyltransferase involved in cell wall biosynthesis